MIPKSYIKVCLCVLLCFFFAAWRSLSLAAQSVESAGISDSWTRTNPGGGGAFTAVGAGPTGLMVVGSDLSGAYISRDQGQSWEPIGATQGLRGRFADNVAAVAFDPQDGNIFYLGTPDGIYRTGDGGRQFQRLNTEQPVIDDVNGEVYTVNGVILDIAIAPSNPNVGYAAWHPYSMAWKEGINARQGQVFRTNDRGLTWAKVSNASLPNTLRLIELIVHPTNPNLLYALSGASREATGDFALYRSRDGGRNWSRLAANIDRIHDIAFDKRNPNILYLTTADILDGSHTSWDCPSPETTGKFYRSDNGGDTWAKLADRSGRIWVDGDDQFAVRLLQPNHQNNWADGCSGLWESINRGITWQRVAEQRNWGRGWYGFDSGYGWSFEPARTLGEDLSNPDRLVWIDDGFVYATADNGRTFQNLHSVEVAPGRWQSRGVDNVVMLDMALGASNNSNFSDVYLAYYDIGCWHSADGGTSWAHCSLPDPNFTDGRKGWDNFTTLVADPTRVGVVWAAHAWDRDDPQTHALLRSEDAGKNWQIITSDAGIMSGLVLDVNSPVNNRTLFVTISEDLYRSQDDGRTWQKVYDCNGCWFTAVDRVNRSLVYAGGDAGFFRSTQGGAAASWRKVNFADFVGRDGNPWWWGDAQDGWQGIHDIVADPLHSGWVYATVFRHFDPDQPNQPQGGLYRSQDGGVTWQQLLPDNYRHHLRNVAVSPLDSRILFVTSSSSNCCGGDPTYSHGVLRSVDGGATWAQFNEGMAWPHARSVAIDPKNPALVWVGSPGTGFQKRIFADLPQPTPTATPVANLIRNGDFSQGVAPWHGGTDTTDLTVRNGELCLDIPTTVTEPAAAQMGQYDLSLEKGQRYQVSFTMVSNVNATVTLILGTSEPPWLHYFAPAVPLTTARQPFNFTFTMKQSTDRNALFTFHLGGNSASVICLDNVVVQKISGTAPTATSTPTASPTATSTPTASPTVTPTPTAPPTATPTATTPGNSIRQSALEIVSDNTATGDGGNIWGGHQTRIVRTAAGVFTAYTVTGSDDLAKEWRLAWRDANGRWPVIAQGLAGREPVNLLAAPDGTLYVIGWPGGQGTIWSGKPANGSVQMNASAIPGVVQGHWPYGSAGIDRAGNLCVLSSDTIFANGAEAGGQFDLACYLASEQRWITQQATLDHRYAYTYVFPKMDGSLALVSTRDVRWETLGYQKPPAAFDYVFNAFRYWRTTDWRNAPLQVRSFAEEPQTAAYLDVYLNAQMDAYVDTQDRMHILYVRRGATTGGQTRFYHRLVTAAGAMLHDGEIQYNGAKAMGWQARLFEDNQGRLYLISGYSGQLFPVAADGFTLGAPTQLNFGGYPLAYTGVALAVPRTGTALSNVMDVVFGTEDERKWIYFQLELGGAPTPIPTPTPTPNPPPAPSNLQAATLSSSQLNLTWRDNANNESGFQIERCQGAACTSFSALASISANVRSYANSGLVADTTYCYRVRATNAAGASAYSNTACRTTGPRPPTSLTANRILATEVNLLWVESVSNETGFRLQRCTGATCSNFAQIALLPANAVGYHDTGLTANTTYRYRVAAVNANGASTYAAIRNVTTTAAATITASDEVVLEEQDNALLPLIVAQPNSYALITHTVACYNQSQPTAVTLLVDGQLLPMVAQPATAGLYAATIAVTGDFSSERDYPLQVQWQCSGEAAPLTDYLGLLQVGRPMVEGHLNHQLYLPVIMNRQ